MSQNVSPRLETALAFARDGIPIFPCVVNGKEPATAHGFKDATTDEATIRAWWAQADYNVAIEPEQAGWAVIDLDGQEGIDAWATIRKDAPETYTVRTPRGGRHLYYSGSVPPSTNKLASKVDTRGVGSYVLIPPSVVNGKPYTIEAKLGVNDLPDWVGPALATKKTTVQHVGPETIDTEAAERDARAYLIAEAAKGPVLEGTRDNTAFRVACWLRDLGCDVETSLALMEELWNVNCHPPLTDDVLRQKIESASRNGQNAPGAYASEPPDVAFKPYLDSIGITGAARSSLPEPKLLREIAGDEKPVETIVQHWVQKHKLNIFRGRGGSNKSRLALQWSMQIDAGKSAVGFTVEKASAVYISCEDDAEEVKRRRNAIARKLSLPPSGVVYFDMTEETDAFLIYAHDTEGVLPTEKWGDLEKRLRAMPGHKFVVLDSTYDVVEFSGSTKNSDSHVRTIIHMFDRLCRKTDSTIVCLWHPSRAGMSRGDEGGFATSWDNTPRNAISIKEDEDGNYILSAEKRNNLAKGAPVVLRWVEGTLQVVVDDDATAIMEHEVVVEVALSAANAGQQITARTKPSTWIGEEIEKRTGHRMKLTQIRDFLQRECRRENSRLTYRTNAHGRGEGAGWVAKTPQ